MTYTSPIMLERRFHLFFWLVVSVAIHIAYVGGLAWVPTDWLKSKMDRSAEKIVVDVISKPPLKEPQPSQKKQQSVRQTEVEESYLIKSSDPARFKSARDQRVVLESRARELGLSKNRQAEPRFLKESRPKLSQPKLSQMGMDYSQFNALNVKREIQDLGTSSVAEILPDDVTVGSFTALNADRFSYYSFFARVEELVRFRWETKIRESMESFNRPYLNQVISKRKRWVTQVEFLLDPSGEINKARIISASGIVKFDQAIVWAFRDARVFPNPPIEMVEPDGFIHLNYSVVVQTENSAWAER